MGTPKEVELDVIYVDDIEEGEKESCLVGRLVTEKHWNPPSLIQVIEKAWKPKHGMSSRVWEESKLILFRFDDVVDRDWVLKNQPWRFKGSLFAIKKFTGGNEQQLSSFDNVTVEHASFWLRLYDVPFSCINEKTLCRFAKRIGSLESVDASGEDLIGKFIRFKISINITKPLLRGITVRVKGESLWLPLKYESLPIFCFFCGTVGHDYNDCRSYNRKLEYNTLELKEIEDQKDTSTTLPHDIVENILSRLPVKYLIRYKSVCKQWEATISDPRFAEMHFQQYKNSCPRNLLAWEQLFDYYKGLYVAEIHDGNLEFVSGIQHSSKYSFLEYEILCDCDGLYMKYYDTLLIRGNAYLLWNPSCRAYKEIWCPQPIDDTETGRKRYGIYYNPLMKDYKVVMTGGEHFAVFSCRYNEWSEVKEMNISCRNGEYWCRGVSFNGSVYWLIINESVIICFDGKVEKFKKLPMPHSKDQEPYSFELTSSGGHLYLFAVSAMKYERNYNEMSIWKKINGEDQKDLWVVHKVLQFGPPHFYRPSPVCWLNESEVILDTDRRFDCLLYDHRKNTFVEIGKSRDTKYDHPVLYFENLFLQ